MSDNPFLREFLDTFERIAGLALGVAIWKVFGVFEWFTLPEPTWLQAAGIACWLLPVFASPSRSQGKP